MVSKTGIWSVISVIVIVLALVGLVRLSSINIKRQDVDIGDIQGLDLYTLTDQDYGVQIFVIFDENSLQYSIAGEKVNETKITPVKGKTVIKRFNRQDSEIILVRLIGPDYSLSYILYTDNENRNPQIITFKI